MIDSKLSLILPAYNEEANIEIVVNEALEELPKVFQRYEVIIVDDGSKDKTPQIADRLAAEHPDNVKVIHHNPNRGYGAALSTGFKAAGGDYLMFMDSDRQFKAEDIQLLAPYIGKADIVAGYRKKRNDPFYRFLIGYTFNMIVTILFGIHLRDIDCGFKVFKADMLKNMKLTSPGALINTEIHAKAQRQGRSIIEVGVNHYPRLIGDQSGASPKVIFRAMKETLALWTRMRNYSPADEMGISRNGHSEVSRQVSGQSKPFPSISLITALGLSSLVVAWRVLRRNKSKKKSDKVAR
ncbi:MAG TPA: glycosyltransferase family 2 protein [Chloroflexia bacterium]|nr:glycosyltransferase family 2 protein [Chloroflexia bacterium]